MHGLNEKKMLMKRKFLKMKILNRFSMLITNKKEKGAPIILARVARASNHKVSSPKVSDNSSLKILTPKQMLQRLPIALAQVKAGNTSENLLSEIRANRMEQGKFLENYVTI